MRNKINNFYLKYFNFEYNKTFFYKTTISLITNFTYNIEITVL